MRAHFPDAMLNRQKIIIGELFKVQSPDAVPCTFVYSQQEATAPAKQCLGFDACGWSACRGELDEVGTGRQPVFVLASSMDSVPRGRARTKSRLRSTLWGATLNCIGIQPRAAGVPGTGASHRYRFKTFVCSGSPRCLPSKTPGVGRAERNGQCGPLSILALGLQQWRRGPTSPASSIASTRPQQRLGRANAASRRWSTRIGRKHRTHIALGPQVMQHEQQRGWVAKSRKSHRHRRLHQSRHHKITHRSHPLSANGP